MSRQVVLTLRALREQHRFVRGLVAWVGFKQTSVTYDRPARFAGETKYPLRKMLRFAIDGITSFSIVAAALRDLARRLRRLPRDRHRAWALSQGIRGHVVRRLDDDDVSWRSARARSS